MKRHTGASFSGWRLLGVLLLALVDRQVIAAAAGGAARIDFNREVRPILSAHCYACHGPDEKQRKAGLRLDQKADAFRVAESGQPVLTPRDLGRSEFWRRVTTADEDDRMPPAKGGKALSEVQLATLKRWIEEGAEWAGHWAYEKPTLPELPEVRDRAWGINGIDRFILAGLEGAGLQPSKPAGRERLLRRVTLDLTGLPPAPGEVDAFVKDTSPGAYEAAVDRLLKSKHYGERMAMFWLDLARYADTQGYHHDDHRDLYRWRDWVIAAYNDNKAFDQFTIEQLAGDLLPGATVEQKIATGFHRNEMTTSEGGAMPEEYAVKYVAGRVDVTTRVWLGTSMACAECHDHKYDPISQKDYYRMFAYFNQVPENGLDASRNPVPRVMLGSGEQNQKLAQMDKEISQLESLDRALLDEAHAARDEARDKWVTRIQEGLEAAWRPVSLVRAQARHGAELAMLEDGSVRAGGTNAPKEVYEVVFRVEGDSLRGLRIDALPDGAFVAGKSGRGPQGEFLLTAVEATAVAVDPAAQGGVLEVGLQPWWSVGPFPAGSAREAYDKKFGPEDGFDGGKSYLEGKLKWVEQRSWEEGAGLAVTGENQATYLHRTLRAERAGRRALVFRTGGGVQVWLNGRRVLSRREDEVMPEGGDRVVGYFKAGDNHLLVKVSHGGASGLVATVPAEVVVEHPVEWAAAVADHNGGGYNVSGVTDDRNTTGWSVGGGAEAAKPHSLFVRTHDPGGFKGGTEVRLRIKCDAPTPGLGLGRFRVFVSQSDGLGEWFELPDGVRAVFLTPEAERVAGARDELRRYYRRTLVPEIKQWVKTLDEQRRARDEFRNAIPVSMVMEDRAQARETFLLVRGEFSNRGERVEPGVPAHLFPMPEGLPSNRLGLARWLVDPNHPLTARVTVNHYWQQYFGTGLVKTAEDFGSQGEWPSHPALLDWLATTFVRSGWDVKAMQKLIVMSATYRQDAAVPAEGLARDPENRLLGRFPRLRLEAEAVRDNALALSGLLEKRVGGPSVYPYQPPGLWEQVAFEGTRSWVQSQGTDIYRRGLYTYWRRSVPYPSLITFDAPTRETCTVRRPRTNTPLQALVLMNDPVYVEASRALGQRILAEGGRTLRERVDYAFRLCLGREATARERALVEGTFRRELKQFTRDRVAAVQLVNVGTSKPSLEVDVCELAAWTVVGNLLLNLDETVNKG